LGGQNACATNIGTKKKKKKKPIGPLLRLHKKKRTGNGIILDTAFLWEKRKWLDGEQGGGLGKACWEAKSKKVNGTHRPGGGYKGKIFFKTQGVCLR